MFCGGLCPMANKSIDLTVFEENLKVSVSLLITTTKWPFASGFWYKSTGCIALSGTAYTMSVCRITVLYIVCTQFLLPI